MPRAERTTFFTIEPGKSPECYRRIETRSIAEQEKPLVVGWSFGAGAVRHEVASMEQWLDLNA